MFGIQKPKQVFTLKYQQQQKLEYFISRNTTGFRDIGLAKQFCNLEFL